MHMAVNQHDINDFRMHGVISEDDLKFLKNHFGYSMTVKYDDDVVVFRNTDGSRKWNLNLSHLQTLLSIVSS